jgi:uncharacterized protein
MTHPTLQVIAFDGDRRIAQGDLQTVAQKAKAHIDQRESAQVLVFDLETSRLVEIDFRGTGADVVQRLRAATHAQPEATPPQTSSPRGPGRPKLGVVAREVTLLPRHWDWLSQQPGGASVVLRKLVDDARKSGSNKDRLRQTQEVAYRFMSAMAGNYPHYEDALRALYANDQPHFVTMITQWPADVREHTMRLAGSAFSIDHVQASA